MRDAASLKAEQEAIKNQAIYGQSQIESEINAIMSGKKEF